MEDNKTDIYKALLKAQADIGPVKKDATNPAFKSKYATLQSVLDTIEKPLSDNGLVMLQRLQVGVSGQELLTAIVHAESGESISSVALVVCKDATDPQKIGGAISYFRRYSLLALLGLAPEDDDGNSASRPAIASSAPTTAKSSYTSSSMGNSTSTGPAGRTFDLNSVYPCDVAHCNNKQEGKWAEICFNKFGKIYCGSHWSQAKSGTLEEEIPDQQTAEEIFGMDKEPLPLD